VAGGSVANTSQTLGVKNSVAFKTESGKEVLNMGSVENGSNEPGNRSALNSRLSGRPPGTAHSGVSFAK
jgi:hypothetical protein